MDSKQFLKVLSKVIREEVRLAVRAEMRIALLESKSSITPNPRTRISSQAPAPRASAPPRQPAPAKRFTQIPGALGDLLNETAVSMMSHPTLAEEQEWPTMGDGDFTVDQVPITDTLPAPSPSHPHPSGDPTMAFVKDYRAVVKAAEAIHNNKY